jgi:hypothetical protein
LQRLATTSTDCVEKLDPRQNATNQYYKPRELDFNARLEKQTLRIPQIKLFEWQVLNAKRSFATG